MTRARSYALSPVGGGGGGRRSVFQTVAVEQVVGLLAADGWSMTPGVVQHCGNMWSTVGASKVTEDLFQRYRWLETQSCHQHPPMSSFREHAISKEVLHKVHRCGPLPMQPLCASEAKASALPKAMYRPSPKFASEDFNGIVGQTTPPWFTCTSTSAALP